MKGRIKKGLVCFLSGITAGWLVTGTIKNYTFNKNLEKMTRIRTITITTSVKNNIEDAINKNLIKLYEKQVSGYYREIAIMEALVEEYEKYVQKYEKIVGFYKKLTDYLIGKDGMDNRENIKSGTQKMGYEI